MDPITPTQASSFSPSISQKDLTDAFKGFTELLPPKADDDTLRKKLTSVWVKVNDVLECDPILAPTLANKQQFKENVIKRGESSFMDKLRGLRSLADSESSSDSDSPWIPLLKDDVFYVAKTPERETHISQAGLNATVHAWGLEYKGNAATALLMTISDFLNLEKEPYSRSTSIVNSSGTGKSRMVDELSVGMGIIIVPMCLRPTGSQGFPPPDIHFRDLLVAAGGSGVRRNREDAELWLHGIVHALLTVTLKHLELIDHSHNPANIISNLVSNNSESYVLAVIEQQKQLAHAFHSHMTEGQSFEGVNSYRELFYKNVVVSADTFVNNFKQDVDGKASKNSPSRYVARDGSGVFEAGNALCHFIDPRMSLAHRKGPRRPLVIFSFDESHILTDGSRTGEWSLFSELRRTLQQLVTLPLFSLFLSTAGRFRSFSPEIKSDPSRRVVNEQLRPLDPITEISFDCLAFPAKENTVTLNQVVQIAWIAHLGRPLFGSHFDGLSEMDAQQREEETLQFAKQKLLDGNHMLADTDIAGSLACLATRFALEFNEDPESRDVSCMQVERHMRLCLAATTGFERLVTCSGSEPVLAEAAYEILRSSDASPVHHLANHANLYCIDRGQRGELVAALIIMQARDASLVTILPRRRWITVTEFMQALLPPSAFDTLTNSLPMFWRKDENISFGQTFENYRMWFNHIIKVQDSKVIQAEFLWKYITRGAMIVCKNNQYAVDIILPVCQMHGELSRRSITAIYIQVKNAVGFDLDVDPSLFTAMDPYKLGLFFDNPQPIIRMVFALGSSKAGVQIPSRGRELHHFHTYTSFDIWCAGLSTDTFRQIGNDLNSYRTLLDRSLQPHDVFDLKETKYRYLGDETKAKRRRLRQSMAPLVMFEGHDGIHQ